MASAKAIKFMIKRNIVSVLFPTVAITAICADLRHTARWKRQLAEQEKQNAAV